MHYPYEAVYSISHAITFIIILIFYLLKDTPMYISKEDDTSLPMLLLSVTVNSKRIAAEEKGPMVPDINPLDAKAKLPPKTVDRDGDTE